MVELDAAAAKYPVPGTWTPDSRLAVLATKVAAAWGKCAAGSGLPRQRSEFEGIYAVHRLSQLDDRQRRRLGSALFSFGLFLLAFGVLFAHYSGFSEGEKVDYFGWFPRGCMIGSGRCVPWSTGGQLIAIGGSQLAIAGALLLWVANQRMTWARAGFAALVVWLEFVIIFGIIPSEWLNLSQGPLEMSRQRIAFTVPSWLVLGNDVSISWSAVKDAVSGAYNMVVLGGAIILAYKIQGWGKTTPKIPADQTSIFGRPLTRGER
jgi:hypothetical protein